MQAQQLSVHELRDGSWRTRIRSGRQAIAESFRSNRALGNIQTLWLSELVSSYYDDTALYGIQFQPQMGFFEVRYGQSQTETPLYVVHNCTLVENILALLTIGAGICLFISLFR
jgi:hypothetical protein